MRSRVLRGYRADPGQWAFHARVEFFYGSLLASIRAGTARDAIQERGPDEMLAIFAGYHHSIGKPHHQGIRCSRVLAAPGVRGSAPANPTCASYRPDSRAIPAHSPARDRLPRRPSLNYLAALESRYEAFVGAWSQSPVLSIDTLRTDFRQATGRSILLQQVTHFLADEQG
jgi:hypothetical protein